MIVFENNYQLSPSNKADCNTNKPHTCSVCYVEHNKSMGYWHNERNGGGGVSSTPARC